MVARVCKGLGLPGFNVASVGTVGPIRLATLAIGFLSFMPCLCRAQESAVTARGFVTYGNSLQDRAFLFIDGRYIPAPYHLQLEVETVQVNGQPLNPNDFDLSQIDEEEFDLEYGFNRGRRHRFGSERARPERRAARQLAEVLEATRMGQIVVLASQRPPLVLDALREGQDLIKTLCSSKAAVHGNFGIPETVTSDVDRETWTQLASEFQPTPDFLARATEQIARQESVQAQNESAVAANIWVERITFPVTVFAMVIVVFAFGHLLTNHPHGELSGETMTPKTRQAVGRSLLIVALLSLVDLILTVAASQVGSMRELNPLGHHMIHDPVQLILFKSITVATAVGLLYWLQRLPIAQVASWWSCLLLTLVTARWLTFSSMFM